MTVPIFCAINVFTHKLELKIVLANDRYDHENGFYQLAVRYRPISSTTSTGVWDQPVVALKTKMRDSRTMLAGLDLISPKTLTMISDELMEITSFVDVDTFGYLTNEKHLFVGVPLLSFPNLTPTITNSEFEQFQLVANDIANLIRGPVLYAVQPDSQIRYLNSIRSGFPTGPPISNFMRRYICGNVLSREIIAQSESDQHQEPTGAKTVVVYDLLKRTLNKYVGTQFPCFVVSITDRCFTMVFTMEELLAALFQLCVNFDNKRYINYKAHGIHQIIWIKTQPFRIDTGLPHIASLLSNLIIVTQGSGTDDTSSIKAGREQHSLRLPTTTECFLRTILLRLKSDYVLDPQIRERESDHCSEIAARFTILGTSETPWRDNVMKSMFPHKSKEGPNPPLSYYELVDYVKDHDIDYLMKYVHLASVN